MASYANAAKAAKFDCGLYITVANVTAFDPGGFTIATWLSWRDPSFKDPCLVQNPGEDPYFTTSAASAWVFAYNDYQDPSNATGGARLTLSVPKGLVLWNSAASLPTRTAINDRQWHFLALSLVPAGPQHDTVVVWLDGSPAARGQLYHDAGFATPNGKQLGLGAEYANGSDGNLFVGGIAEFQIWRGALTRQRVAALMAAPPNPAAEPDLLAYIPLDQASVANNAVADLVGRHTGRITVYRTR
jgi:hypothetical protein